MWHLFTNMLLITLRYSVFRNLIKHACTRIKVKYFQLPRPESMWIGGVAPRLLSLYIKMENGG
jgi:hypothetical protein